VRSVKPKTVTRQALVAEQGVNLIQRIVLEMGSRWSPTQSMDVGIDGTIELCNPASGEALGVLLHVQSKASEQPFVRETSSGFEFLCDSRDLDYWMKGNAPVILVVSRPSAGEAYWVSIKDYFADPSVRAERRIRFDKDANRFSAASFDGLLHFGQPSAAGLYFTPPPTTEVLRSNLLCVTSVAPTVFVAEATFGDRQAVFDDFARRGVRITGEWVLREKRIVSFLDLRDPVWREVCERGSVEEFGADEWAESDDPDRHREYVQLLNAALREKLFPDVRFWGDQRLYAFTASKNLADRRVRYRRGKGYKRRLVFSAYRAQDDRHVIAYRHLAFDGRFKEFDKQWYMEITPTYLFTKNGREVSRFHEAALTRMKQLDRHQAVLGNLLVWVDRLQRNGDLFSRAYPHLSFGDLLHFTLNAGIDDGLWIHRDEQAGDGEDDPMNLGLLAG
jgi:hypothetical protein